VKCSEGIMALLVATMHLTCKTCSDVSSSSSQNWHAC